MNWGLVWSEVALDELADVWVTTPATGRDAVHSAVLEIERELRQYADTEGESRPANHRIAYYTPLGILYSLEPEQVARIIHVWRFTRS